MVARSAWVAVALGLLGGRAGADEIHWRHDYAAARAEAARTGKPLLFDFGTEACFWCKKLDATTFRVPAVVAAVNAGFVPVKIDANQHAKLTQAVGVESFPTLVVAGPDGAVLDRHEGYADGAAMAQFLGRVAKKLPPPVVPVSAVVTASDPWADARAEIGDGLGRVYLERGTGLYRGGRTAEAVGCWELAAGLAPTSETAKAAREWLARRPR